MSRYRLLPAPAQEAVLRDHCAHARYVWNLGNRQVVGIDRGVMVSAALSTGELLHAPGLTARDRHRLRRLERKFARSKRGSNRRGRVKHAIAGLRARERDRRKDWAEKASTDNAARNIAAGHAVTARGGCRDTGPANREPQLLASLTGRQ